MQVASMSYKGCGSACFEKLLAIDVISPFLEMSVPVITNALTRQDSFCVTLWITQVIMNVHHVSLLEHVPCIAYTHPEYFRTKLRRCTRCHPKRLSCPLAVILAQVPWP